MLRYMLETENIGGKITKCGSFGTHEQLLMVIVKTFGFVTIDRLHCVTCLLVKNEQSAFISV